MRILITGTEGYIGSVLAPLLTNRGHEIIGIDTGFYKDGCLYDSYNRMSQVIDKDIRHIGPDDLRGIEAIVHLAELSNDPVGQLSPDVTLEINHQGTVRLATLAKAAGVRRFVYTSSCSVYGVATDGFASEESPVKPQTPYAVCKTLVERDLKAMASDDFSPTFLRNATAYGASPRMRFDIVLNNLAGLAWTIHEIRMTSDGTLWRPLVHVLDICKAIRCVLEAQREVVHNEVFNVGKTEHNYRVRDIAEVVAQVFKGCELTFGVNDGDDRSYRVSFEKINRELPGFSCEWEARRGAEQLYDLFTEIDMSKEIFEFRGFTRLQQLKYLLETAQIDKRFFWREEKSVRG